MTRVRSWTTRGHLLFLTLLLLAPGKAAIAGEAILTETSYCRSYYQFGCDRLSPAALKAEGEVRPALLDRLQRQTKALLADRNIDWTKEDWRGHAVTYQLSSADPMVKTAVLFAPGPPEAWRQADFDDSAWGRFSQPLAVGPRAGIIYWERGNMCAGFQAAYLRFHFDLPDPAAAGDLVLTDDETR